MDLRLGLGLGHGSLACSWPTRTVRITTKGRPLERRILHHAVAVAPTVLVRTAIVGLGAGGGAGRRGVLTATFTGPAGATTVQGLLLEVVVPRTVREGHRGAGPGSRLLQRLLQVICRARREWAWTRRA
jgi:hypothetical protein